LRFTVTTIRMTLMKTLELTEQNKTYIYKTHEEILAGLKAWEAIDNYLPLATPNELKRAIGLAILGGLNMTKEMVRMADEAVVIGRG
jgi:hypothetical protein